MRTSPPTLMVRVWDLPTRIFHWLLLLVISGAIGTGLIGGNVMDWHERLGIASIALVAFRIAWGFFGPTYARFGNFIPGPRTIVHYLQGRWHGLGHNPLGALSILSLLGLILFQGVSGTMANDDIAFNGPLATLVAPSTSDLITRWHKESAWILLGFIGLHIAAALFYRFVRGEDLITPMVTGRRPATGAGASDTTGGGWIALLTSIAIAILAGWLLSSGLLTPSAPALPSNVPDW